MFLSGKRAPFPCSASLRWLACLLAFVLALACLPVAAAFPVPIDREAEAAAERLKSLTLFVGTGKGFDLHRSGTRAEGTVMFARLLGYGGEVARAQHTHPFTDVPKWAAGAVGLLWHLNLTSGTSGNTFNAEGPLTGRQYCTFLLRALGHGTLDKATYAASVARAADLGLLDVSDRVALYPDEPILRADMVRLSERALSLNMLPGTRTLLDTLVLNQQVPPVPAGQWLAARLVPEILGTHNPEAMSEYDRSKAFHDWLIQKNTYGWLSDKEDSTRRLSYRGYTALAFGTGVCGAYSEAMQFLSDAGGLSCRTISGRANGTNGWSGHAWNQVRIDDNWYHVDVTFDDPVGVEILRYNYFHVTDADLSRDHEWERTTVPACTSTAANWFVRNRLTVSSLSAFQHSVDALVAQRGTEIIVRAIPFSPAVYHGEAIAAALSKSGVVRGYTHSLDPVMGVIRITDVRYAADAVGLSN